MMCILRTELYSRTWIIHLWNTQSRDIWLELWLLCNMQYRYFFILDVATLLPNPLGCTLVYCSFLHILLPSLHFDPDGFTVILNFLFITIKCFTLFYLAWIHDQDCMPLCVYCENHLRIFEWCIELRMSPEISYQTDYWIIMQHVLLLFLLDVRRQQSLHISNNPSDLFLYLETEILP